jgi:amino acid transporter
VYLIYICPALLVIYGILSYVLTKEVIGPQLLFLGTLTIIFLILNSFKQGLQLLGMAVCITIIPFVVSLITMLIVKKDREFKQRMKEEENSKNESDLMS